MKRPDRRNGQRAVLLAVMVLVVLNGVVSCSSTTATPTEQLSSAHLGLVYYSEQDGIQGKGALYFYDLGSGERRRLTERDEAVNPYASYDWSPAAGRVVYVAGPQGQAEVFTVDLSGQHRQRLTYNQVDESSPIWSPDGSQIAFAGRSGEDNWILRSYMMNADGSAIRRLFDDSRIVSGSGIWSPDGQRIALLVGDLTDPRLATDILIFDARTWQEITRISDGLNHLVLVWSPGGTRLALSAGRNSDMQLYVADVATGASTKVSDINQVLSVDWSPDGQWLIFSDSPSATSSIYMVRPDGTDLRKLTSGLEYAMGGVWSPDGKEIAFAGALANGILDICVMNVETGACRNITNDEFMDGGPIWVTW